MEVLLSIKPEFVDKIFTGEKQFEYRKVIFLRKDVEKVIIYSTLPEGKIVGEFSVEKIITDTPKMIWSQTKSKSGIDKKFFDEYFSGRSRAHAIKIGNVRKYIAPIKLDEIKGKVSAPQSFQYISRELIKDLVPE